MKDLSSGAVLYAKNADQRIPPASMAKMMTVYVAFDMIKKGQLKLDRHGDGEPRDVEEVAWARRGIDHVPVARRAGFGRQSAARHHHACRATMPASCWPSILPAPSPPSPRSMNQQAKEIGLTNSHFGTSNGWPDGGVTYVTARDLATLATATIQNFPDLYKQFYSRPNFTWGKTHGLGRGHHPGQSRSAAGPRRRRRRAQDRPYRGIGLRLHRIGRAEWPPAGDGRCRA